MEDDSNDTTIINNKYKMIEFLGKGGFGWVYKVEDIDTKDQYAGKILRKIDESQFQNEKKMLEIVSELKNPYIVNLKECGEEEIKLKSRPLENRQYIILDYATEGDLCNYILSDTDGFENKTGKLIFHKILKGLEAIHRSGICHRDLKIDNILMDKYFNPKICDFGLATELKGKDGSGKLSENVGTDKYKPPEMHYHEDYDGVKADIFCLGIVLFTLTTGSDCFGFAKKSNYFYNFIYKNQFDKYWKSTGFTKLDEDLKKLIFQMLSFEPEKRPSIKEILESTWMKEIIDLNSTEYKKLEEEIIEKFKKIKQNIIEENGTLAMDKEVSEKAGENRGISETNRNYFGLDLIPKYATKTGLNMKHYLKIIGDINPCELMNRIANKIKNHYGDKVDIIPSSLKLKFDACFENIEEEIDEENNNEEKEEDNEEDDENTEDEIEEEKSVIQVKLFESQNGGYIVIFTKKKGGTIKYYKYLRELRKLIKELGKI